MKTKEQGGSVALLKNSNILVMIAETHSFTDIHKHLDGFHHI